MPKSTSRTSEALMTTDEVMNIHASLTNLAISLRTLQSHSDASVINTLRRPLIYQADGVGDLDFFFFTFCGFPWFAISPSTARDSTMFDILRAWALCLFWSQLYGLDMGFSSLVINTI